MSRSVVLVGATSPLGAAVAGRFLAAGDRVAAISLESAGIPGLAADLVADCSRPEDATGAVDEAALVLGGVDVLVAAAGAMPVAPAHATSDDDWRRAMAACLDTYFFTARAALPHMRAGSAIVAVSSMNSRISAPWLAAYTAAKGGVDALTRQLSVEYGDRGIRVNAVSPGLVGGDEYPDAHAGYPLGRTITPDEVAAAIFFLADPDASGINGVVLPIDGGISVASPAASLRVDLRSRFDRMPPADSASDPTQSATGTASPNARPGEAS